MFESSNKFEYVCCEHVWFFLDLLTVDWYQFREWSFHFSHKNGATDYWRRKNCKCELKTQQENLKCLLLLLNFYFLIY